MNAALTFKTRDELRTRLSATLAFLFGQAEELTVEALVAAVEADASELAVRGFEAGLKAALGDEMGAVAFADLTSTADRPNTELLEGSLTRAAVSKTLCRVRRNLGLPTRVPANARKGRKPRSTQ